MTSIAFTMQGTTRNKPARPNIGFQPLLICLQQPFPRPSASSCWLIAADQPVPVKELGQLGTSRLGDNMRAPCYSQTGASGLQPGRCRVAAGDCSLLHKINKLCSNCQRYEVECSILKHNAMQMRSLAAGQSVLVSAHSQRGPSHLFNACKEPASSSCEQQSLSSPVCTSIRRRSGQHK